MSLDKVTKQPFGLRLSGHGLSIAPGLLGPEKMICQDLDWMSLSHGQIHINPGFKIDV